MGIRRSMTKNKKSKTAAAKNAMSRDVARRKDDRSQGKDRPR